MPASSIWDPLHAAFGRIKDTFVKTGEKIREGTLTVANSVSKAFTDLWLKIVYALNKAKWGLLAFIIIIVVAIILGVLSKFGLLQQALLYMATFFLFLIKFTFKLIDFTLIWSVFKCTCFVGSWLNRTRAMNIRRDPRRNNPVDQGEMESIA